ncbi:Osmotin, thaumatin-like protein [Parathielavia hyrcaniae]|uniref:Osmotin, thaumatin-like protein n=1 Tax=Parathielavia hyrcaniae TaxID=113614 RepID=A0AAN6Q612_9PEZI|nr:Osmotin, thaumatin-like protein [Parathielavia hyrcaniae]
MPDWVAKGAAANPRSIPANTTAESPSDLTPIQLIVTNGCSESIWPGILTQNGTGPGTGGFELTPGNSRLMFVSSNWGGRVWGRTNCGSFSGDGSGHRTSNGVDGDKTACLTGDCIGKLNCTLAGRAPATVAEFTLQGGSNNNQTFYDISLVDGYNLPMAIIYHPSPNTTWIPPNLTNCACIASAGYLSPSPYFSPSASPDSPSDLNTNSTYPMPFEPMQTDNTVQGWCPVPLQVPAPNPATAPAAGDNTTTTITTTPSPVTGNTGNPLPVPSHRPPFQPCLSPCAATRNPSDCCTGPYNSPDTCEPSRYSHGAKRVCPDAYSFAYDDGASTFVVPHEPAGAGWEVRFCPRGRSTDILRAFGDEVRAVGAGTGLSAEGWERVRSWEYVEEKETGWTAGGVVVGRGGGGAWIAVLGAVAVMVWIAG